MLDPSVIASEYHDSNIAPYSSVASRFTPLGSVPGRFMPASFSIRKGNVFQVQTPYRVLVLGRDDCIYVRPLAI